ncbi:interleukin-6 receptor subunit beta [Thunnus maccoyii]|uniref:interleukin-6 receptor subunit beta n=1 Tax=Thunnus maccoyii TaxID=8240 RepID=UPI001C4A8254|nr:interleukin-6 receptor subunit beta [Thunnus maccoyii]
MDIWCLKQLSAWTVVSLLCVSSHKVTVKETDLNLCEKDDKVCVTDFRDCNPRTSTSILKTLNMSCFYQMSNRSVTCEWGQSDGATESDASLIFSSDDKVISCKGIFIPVANLKVTAKVKDYTLGREIWSQPHNVFLFDIMKPSQPALTLLGSTEDSVTVSWNGSRRCRLRYRVNNTHTWTQAPDLISARPQNYTIKDLLPFTVYRASVACKEDYGIWSDWSSDITARTLERAPSRPPEVCYRVEKTDSGERPQLRLMWKDLDLSEAGGRILGYQVSYKPVKEWPLQDRTLIQNVTEVTALLVVEEGNCNVTVKAFNEAGYGPATCLKIDTHRQNTLPSVRNLWVSSSVKDLLVQWEIPAAPPVSHYDVQWRPETRPSTCCWTRVGGLNTSAVIKDVDPDVSYMISVFPVVKQQCGSPQSLAASLQQGALMEVVRPKVVDTTKTTVTVAWAWQRKTAPIRVNRYALMLRKDAETQTLLLWPDQWQHTFLHLEPNTEYSLHLLADNVSRNIIPVRTHFDEIPVVAAVTPLLLLAVTVLIISILSRTVYKSYFFPRISSPRGSTTGQWLMYQHHERTRERSILDIEDFQVTDGLRVKSVIMVGPNSQPSMEEDLHEDTPVLSLSHLIIKLDLDYVSDSQPDTEQQPDSLQSFHPNYTVKGCYPDDTVFTSEENREANYQTHGVNG